MPSLICAPCIDRLRVAYDFRNSCLQSDQTLQRYLGQLQEEVKQNDLPRLPVSDFNMTTTQDVAEQPRTAEYIPLKHFLDNDEEMAKTEGYAETGPAGGGDGSIITTTVYLNFEEQQQNLEDRRNLQLEQARQQEMQTVQPMMVPAKQEVRQVIC